MEKRAQLPASFIPKFVEQRRIEEVAGDDLQTSSLFEIDGKPMAILTDIENNSTILSDIPSRLGDEISVLFRTDTAPGIQVDLDMGARVEGYGVFTFPYGPVSSGVPEAGGFKLITYGERIVKVIPQINFKKRGVERRVIDMKPDDALLLIERSAGNFSASYSTCFVTSVENSLGMEVPSRAKWIRAVAVELERIYNHLYIFGRLAEAASQNVATSKANVLRERVLRINAKYFHHRFLFGVNRIGGVNCDLAKDERRNLSSSVGILTNELSDLVSYFLSSRIFLDRLQNTAKLPKHDALKLGAVGPSARGSGIGWDDRLTFPIEPYNDIIIETQTDNDEDAMARTLVRIREIQSSTLMLEQLLDRMPSGEISKTHLSTQSSSASGHTEGVFSFCRIESPSGDLIHVVQLDQKGRIKMLHIRPSSLVNWMSFARSLEGNVFTDFQFAFESFGLSYADSDR
jgi:Ni,Fe-hydrogenase III large subunit